MSQALLFDLDGTLIQSSMEVFLPSYFASLTKRVADLVAPSKFIAQLQESTRLMIANNDPARTNADVFAADFFPKIGLSSEQLMPIFDDFYTREYRDLRAYIRPIPLSRQIIARAFERRHTVVIATMPVFPLTAIQQRLQWGDLADFPYALITHYAMMHASKPNPAYYREIAQQLNVAPGDCVMIGNDVQMDILPAKRAGMRVFWLTDVGAVPTDVPADWRGTLADFAEVLESL